MSRARASSGDRGSQQSQSKHFLPSLDGSGIIDSVIGAGDDDSELQYSNSQPDSRVGRSSPYRRGPRINDGGVNTSNRYVQQQQVHHPPPHNHNHPIQQQRRKKEQHAPHPMQNKVIIATTTIEDTMMNDNASSRKYSYYNPASVLEASSSARTTSRLANEQAESKRQALVQKLTSYTRGMDRRQVLRTINDTSVFPKMHTLKLGVVEDIAEAEREAARERGVLNGVKFLQLGMVGTLLGRLKRVMLLCSVQADLQSVLTWPQFLLQSRCFSFTTSHRRQTTTEEPSKPTNRFLLPPNPP